MLDPIQILLVEDDPDQRDYFILVLKQARYNVIDVPDAETALTHLANGNFALLLTDCNLPGMHGDLLIAKVRQDYPAMKTILMSSYAHVNDAAHACSANGWFRKADSFSRLQKVITGVLAAE